MHAFTSINDIHCVCFRLGYNSVTIDVNNKKTTYLALITGARVLCFQIYSEKNQNHCTVPQQFSLLVKELTSIRSISMDSGSENALKKNLF